MVATTIMIGIGLTPILQQQSANALSDPDGTPVSGHKTPLPHHIPIATSGNNIYIVWWDNKTGNNDEVMFKVQLTEARLLEIKLISAILLRLIHRTHRLTHLEIMITA